MKPFERGQPDVAPIVSVICATNDVPLMERMLLASLRRQAVPWELRAVDAKAEGLSCAADVLNAGAIGASGRYLMFAHQDVSFDEGFLDTVVRDLDGLDDVGVAGPVGATLQPPTGRQRVVNSFYIGPDKRLVQLHEPLAPMEVQSLDEMMLIVPRRRFEAGLRFDAEVCPGWHLYGIDLCLEAARRGLRVVVLPVRVHHLSGGTLDDSYYASLRRVLAKHRKSTRWVATPSEVWPTFLPGFLQKPVHLAKTAARVAARRWRGV